MQRGSGEQNLLTLTRPIVTFHISSGLHSPRPCTGFINVHFISGGDIRPDVVFCKYPSARLRHYGSAAADCNLLFSLSEASIHLLRLLLVGRTQQSRNQELFMIYIIIYSVLQKSKVPFPLYTVDTERARVLLKKACTCTSWTVLSVSCAHLLSVIQRTFSSTHCQDGDIM